MIFGAHNDDCLAGCQQLDAGSVDMVFADLPYGTTQNTRDRKVSLDKLWVELKRVCKPGAVLVFTAMQPFTSELVLSNTKWFRYAMVWKKNKSRGFLNAKRQPLRSHEDILVFYGKQPRYVPQMTADHTPVHAYVKHTSDGTNYGKTKQGVRGGGSTDRYPTSVLAIPVLNNDDPLRVNATQKPEALSAWFIQTYTKPGDVVLDPTFGSGSTLVEAKLRGRQYVGFDTDVAMVSHANRWLDGTPNP